MKIEFKPAKFIIAKLAKHVERASVLNFVIKFFIYSEFIIEVLMGCGVAYLIYLALSHFFG
jgi:hypothetical protein